MRRLLIATVVGLAVALSAFAQTASAPPDFSGRWALNFAKSKLGILNMLRSQTIIITGSRKLVLFRETSTYFTVTSESQTTFTTTNESQTAETYIPDGQEHIYNPDARLQYFTKAEWKNSALFTEWGLHDSAAPGADRWNNHKERWTLSGDGNTLTRDTGERYVYDKR